MWSALGLVLAAIELATPGGFFVVFFGAAAIVIGLLELAGLVTTAWVQWLLFPVLAIAALRIFRSPLLKMMGVGGPDREMDSLVGEVASPVEPMLPGGHGRAEARGTTWNARNVADLPLAVGQRCRIVAVDGLLLDLRPE